MPHMGGNTVETVQRQSKSIVTGILAFLKGEKSPNILNPEVFN
jgi:lactate dehydrogenase-like 2-hydroxyacid dehydrogenase